MLDALAARFPLAVVTDGQSAWARAELHRVGLDGYFDPVVVSGDHGYRKPDRRLFEHALSRTSGWPPSTPSTSATTCTATCTAPARPG